MKRFKSSLDKILQLRKFREEECRMELGKAVSVLNMIENEIKTTAQKRSNAASMRFSNVNEISEWESYIIRLDQQAQKLLERSAQAQIVVEEKRALYMEALKDVKAIEKPREEQYKEYRKEMFNSQMAEIDDLTSARLSIAGR